MISKEEDYVHLKHAMIREEEAFNVMMNLCDAFHASILHPHVFDQDKIQ